MYEYRIESFSGRKTEDEVNRLAMEGWRVIAVRRLVAPYNHNLARRVLKTCWLPKC